MNILVIGENALDIIIRADLEIKSDSNVFPEEVIMRPGGTGFNFSLAYKKMGGNPFYFCPISKDFFGGIIKEKVKKEGIESAYFESEKPTPLIFTIVNKKFERSTIANIFNTSYTDISFEHFVNLRRDFPFAYVSGGILTEEKPQKEVLKILRILYEKGAQIFFDPQFRIGKKIPNYINFAIEILSLSDYVLANEDEMNELPETALKERLNKGVVFVHKRGERGAFLQAKDKKFEVGGIKVKKANVTGAGDVFNAAFIYKILSNQSIENSLIFANEIAAEFVASGEFAF